MQNFKEYIKSELMEAANTGTASGSKLPVGTPIDDNAFYLVQYDFKNGFRDVMLKNLYFERGRELRQKVERGDYDYKIKAGKIELGKPIGVMHTYAIADKKGYQVDSFEHQILKLKGQASDDEFELRVVGSYFPKSPDLLSQANIDFLIKNKDKLPKNLQDRLDGNAMRIDHRLHKL